MLHILIPTEFDGTCLYFCYQTVFVTIKYKLIFYMSISIFLRHIMVRGH